MPPSRLASAAQNPRAVSPSSVLIIDDSVVARSMMARMIAGSGRFEVVGSVPTADAGLAFLRKHRVDTILLDIEMPGIDGLTALPDILAAGRGAKVLIVSSSCAEGAVATIKALALGAADTLVKPGIGSFAGRFSELLQDRLIRLVEPEPDPVPAAARRTTRPAPVTPAAKTTAPQYDVVVIGASTGGIHALSQLLRAIPADFQVPILVTQHLPASFMPYFANQLSVLASRPCDVAEDRMRITPGRILVAPGTAHLQVRKTSDGASIRLTHQPVTSGCLPSVDPMFASIAEVYGPRALAIVLSGMGRDGSEGAALLATAGAGILVQDRGSSVVWGMPGSVAGLGLANAVLPPDEIGRIIASRKRLK